MNEETKKLIMFLLLHADKEIRYGYSIERSSVLASECFEIRDGVLYLDTYEGM